MSTLTITPVVMKMCPFEAEEVGQTHLLMEKREGLM
jgi:hypothetical protein